ncbi:uncharacterized protein [Oscarella lobularis]|uniref:uncharacterized protein n=1 Tax=Oscarella lobularis TaxID=121494 RepID=UPI0033139B9B
MASSGPESIDVIVKQLEQLDSLSFAVVVGVAAKLSSAFSANTCHLTVAAHLMADDLSHLKTKIAKLLEQADPDFLDAFKDNLQKAHQAHLGVAPTDSLRHYLLDVRDKFDALFEELEKKTKSKKGRSQSVPERESEIEELPTFSSDEPGLQSKLVVTDLSHPSKKSGFGKVYCQHQLQPRPIEPFCIPTEDQIKSIYASQGSRARDYYKLFLGKLQIIGKDFDSIWSQSWLKLMTSRGAYQSMHLQEPFRFREKLVKEDAEGVILLASDAMKFLLLGCKDCSIGCIVNAIVTEIIQKMNAISFTSEEIKHFNELIVLDPDDKTGLSPETKDALKAAKDHSQSFLKSATGNLTKEERQFMITELRDKIDVVTKDIAEHFKAFGWDKPGC